MIKKKQNLIAKLSEENEIYKRAIVELLMDAQGFERWTTTYDHDENINKLFDEIHKLKLKCPIEKPFFPDLEVFKKVVEENTLYQRAINDLICFIATDNLLILKYPEEMNINWLHDKIQHLKENQK